MSKLRHREVLLADIRIALGILPPRTPLGAIKIEFQGGDVAAEFDLAGALGAIENDLFFNEDGDYSDANRAVVRVL